MDIYEVSPDYVNFLRKYEPKRILINSDDKSQRKFIGVIVKREKYNYVVPLSSPKYKKDYSINGYSEDFLPEDFSFIKYKNRIVLLKHTTTPVVYMYSHDADGIDLLGKLQCNNMIPVPDSELFKVKVEEIADIGYKTLLNKQIIFIRKNEDELLKKHINVVYQNQKNKRMDIGYISKATPDFDLLEAKHDEWLKNIK
ncbi:MAG: type III toxin-antitoxin system ToxN/AbiQ family toxin [Clostridia bacterium]|nr:type III toxin-antitoxin system ToxN/AbiQ family toxin [Clostridia bacterium]